MKILSIILSFFLLIGCATKPEPESTEKAELGEGVEVSAATGKRTIWTWLGMCSFSISQEHTD